MGTLRRWLLPVLRYGLCAAALIFLYFTVSWHDHVRLQDGSKLRLLAQREDAFVVLHEGREQLLPPDAVQRVGPDQLPAIEYGIRGVVLASDWRLALLAIVIFAPVPFLCAFRLVWMLAIQEVRLSLWNSVKFSFAGNFFNFALPGTTGGDLVKAYYVSRYTHRKTEAVTTVFLDRVVGLLGLMIVASSTFVLAWSRIGWDPAYRNRLAAGMAFVWLGLLAGCLVVFSRRLRHAVGLPQLAARLPAAEQLLRIGRTTVAMRQRKGLVLLSLLATISLQLLVVVSAYVMSLALGMRGGFALYFVCVPIGFLIAAVPIAPPQAIGVMEWAYIIFFAHGGLNPKSAAFAFALANRVIQLVWSLPGVLVPLLGLHLPSQRELAELERSAEAAREADDTGGESSAVPLASAPSR